MLSGQNCYDFMRKILLFSALFACFQLNAQFNTSAPWMQDLLSKKGLANKGELNIDQSFSIDEISEAFWAYWRDKDYLKKGSGFKPGMRWINYWQNLADERGMLPTPREQMAAFKRKNDGRFQKNPTASWSAVGPVAPGNLAGSLPGVGRLNEIAVDPNNSDIWYAGAPAGGIWKSTNAGTSWTHLLDGFLQVGVSSIAIDPNDSDTIYIATGDDDAQDSYSVGVYKSTNGGSSWSATGLSIENTTDFPNWGNNRLLSNLVIDPTNSDIIWAAGSFGIWKSLDGGDSWERKQVGNFGDFKLKPGDPNTAYAVSAAFGAGDYYRTTDGDTFTQITDILPDNSSRLVIDVSPENPEVLYILSADTTPNRKLQGLFRSTDSGLTFTEISVTAPNVDPNRTEVENNIMESNQAWFDLAMAVDPLDSNRIYMGCLNVWASTNGGSNFVKQANWFSVTSRFTYADIHTIKFLGGRIFVCSDGGLFVSENNGQTFERKNGNMNITQFYRMSIANDNNSVISGGSQDNSGFVFNNNSWNKFTSGDGMDYEVDPNNSSLIYGFVQNGQVLFITTNSGQSVSDVPQPRDEENRPIFGNWITPLAVSVTGEVYSGFDALYRLNGNEWEKISVNLSNDSNVSDIEVSKTNPEVLWVAQNDLLYRSTNGGISFQFIDRMDAPISDIGIHSTNPNIAYVTTSRRVGNSDSSQPSTVGILKVTIDQTIEVEDLTRNLSIDQAFFSVVHQGKHSQNPIFVGTSLGVFRLDDSLTDWENYFTNLPSVAVSDLEISLEKDKETLVASTYGRGVWQSPLPVEIQNDDIAILSVTPDFTDVVCGSVAPSVTVENNGLNDITEIQFTYSAGGGSENQFTYTGLISPDAQETIDLPAISEQVPFGQVNLNISVSIAGETQLDDNTSSTFYYQNAFANGDQLFDFEEGNTTLLSQVDDVNDAPLWEQGVPSGSILNTASSGTQVFGTNLDGNHPDETKAYLVSGCYEMANIVAPVLKFDMAYDLEQDFDIVYVEYSLDDGVTWQLLGTTNSQPNWYTSDRTFASSGGNDCQNCPGGQWTGTDGTMREYAYDFVANANLGETDLTNEPKAVFRIVFHSDPLENQEGAIVDDFIVTGFQDDDDDDNDGILDVDDNCPLTANSDQADNDGDGIGDVCDDDDDNDGILDVNDNCPFTANADQADFDQDGIGDICDPDIDNDGVSNDIDQCDNSPANATVDVDGCEVFSLSADNFSLTTIGESCIESNNASVNITAAEALAYTASLSDASGPISTQGFTDQVTFENLEAGAYSICITVDGQSGFEQCFNVQLTEPEPLSVSSKVDNLDSRLSLELSGGAVYFIEANGEQYQTSDSFFELTLKEPSTTLKVSTDKACQGTFEKTIVLANSILVFPNPLDTEILNVYLGSTAQGKVKITLFNSVGQAVFTKSYNNQGSNIEMNLSSQPTGLYFLNIDGAGQLQTFKLIKR